jgi:hypothetical protein
LATGDLVFGGRGFDTHMEWGSLKALRGALDQAAIPYVDPSEAMHALAMQYWPLTVPGDDHYRQEGHRLIAELVGRALSDLDGPEPAWAPRPARKEKP